MSAEIIATIGPSSDSAEILRAFKVRQVSAFRLNLSHTNETEIESKLTNLQKADVPIIVDLEGSQVRTGNLAAEVLSLQEGEVVKIYPELPKKISGPTITLRPREIFKQLEVGMLFSIDFQSILLKVTDTSSFEQAGYLSAEVVLAGTIRRNKAVLFDEQPALAPYSLKDFTAIEIAKKLGITTFHLSYVRSAEEVLFFRQMYPQATVVAKIETAAAAKDFDRILQAADGILIDRGDLSEEVSAKNVPLLQKAIITACKKAHKKVYVATDILESMTQSLHPNRSEISDVVTVLLDGADGVVLTKESAIGEHPVETVNVLRSIITQTQRTQEHFTEDIEHAQNVRFISQQPTSGLLIPPHGGKLVNGFRTEQFEPQALTKFPVIDISEEICMDLEQLAFGVYSPLTGFMNKLELTLVLESMRLPNGLPWTMPILLPIDSATATNISVGKTVALRRRVDGEIYGTIQVSEIYSVDKNWLVKKWFGTTDQKHPGVRTVTEMPSVFLAGKINLLKKRPTEFKKYELTPQQSRRIFEDKSWSRVVAFHTRNAIHRSHEFLQLESLKRVAADGLFVHPVIGKKKSGDFEASIIIKSYELMMQHFYPKGRVVMGAYATYSRYAGPREAIFTALCRKNFGCSHFVIGRDHTGVGDFYGPWASHEIFAQFPDLGIEPIFFKKVSYSKKKQQHVEDGENLDKQLAHISGTEARKILLQKKQPPSWFMRPEISAMILKEIKSGNTVFVP